MNMTIADEFKTVDLVLESDAETRGVDAFALSLIKAEKQARRLVTYLVYQQPWCGPPTAKTLVDELANSKNVYFKGLVKGWDALYPSTVQTLVGVDYPRPRVSGAERCGRG